MEYLLNGLITNYRQAVAFASFIIARYEILKRSMPDFQDNINVAEWYGLQLICFFFPELYRRLERQPESVLSNIFNIYRFSDDPTEPDKFSPSETRLLSMLFGGKPALGNERGIAHVKNYYNYFAMRVMKTEVSQKEFSAMLSNHSGELEPILNEWLARRPSVVNSVSALFARHKLTKMSAMEAANYTEALILWWLLSGDYASLAAIDDIPVTPYNVEAFHSGQESYFYTLNALVGREDFDVIRLCQAIKIQSYPPEDPRAGEDVDYDEPLRFLNEAESNILFSNLVNKAFERGLVKGVDDLADKDSLLTNILWNSETEIELEDGFIMAINWAVSEVIKRLEEMVKFDPQAKGRNLAGFRKIYEPQYTGDQETDADRGMESELLIRRTFGSHDRYQQVIAELFEAQ